jgi:hypothetical protein
VRDTAPCTGACCATRPDGQGSGNARTRAGRVALISTGHRGKVTRRSPAGIATGSGLFVAPVRAGLPICCEVERC